MKFSVIIPTYNYSQYLHRCLASITKQKYLDCEIIIVDDGSTDNTKEIVKEIQHEFPNYSINYIWQKNNGLSSARNHGIKEAKGNYIWFLDADDYLSNNSLHIIDDYLDNNPNTEMLFGGYKAIYKNKTVDKYPSRLSECIYKNFKNFIKRKFRGLTIGATIIKKELTLKYSFPENVDIGEDYILFAKILGTSNQCHSLQKILVNKSRNSGTSLRNDYKKGAYSQINCVPALFGDADINRDHCKLKNYFTSTKYLSASRCYYHLKEYQKSISCYFTAVSKYPPAIFRMKYLRIILKSLHRLIRTKLSPDSKLGAS